MALLEPTAGYTTLLNYVQKLLKEQHLTEQLIHAGNPYEHWLIKYSTLPLHISSFLLAF